MNDMHNDHLKIGLHIRYNLSDLDLYIMTLSELCLKGISLNYLICVVYGYKVSQAKHGTQWDRVDWFRGGNLNGFRSILALPVSGDKQGMEPPCNIMNYIPSDVP
jgi:hypothetical protein